MRPLYDVGQIFQEESEENSDQWPMTMHVADSADGLLASRQSVLQRLDTQERNTTHWIILFLLRAARWKRRGSRLRVVAAVDIGVGLYCKSTASGRATRQARSSPFKFTLVFVGRSFGYSDSDP